MSGSKQLAFKLRTHGGKRRGAGRKPKGAKALVSHAPRPSFNRPTPAHVTLKVRGDVPNLRSSRRFAIIRHCFAKSRGLHGLRLVHFSVLDNHLHLVVEADCTRSLSRGMNGLCTRLARQLNALLKRRGKLFADHYHSRLLRSPTEVTRAIRYILGNAARHYEERGVDPFSSAASGARPALAEAVGWLLLVGWRRAPG
jgi:REP element-mobilizing transposase RayT